MKRVLLLVLIILLSSCNTVKEPSVGTIPLGVVT